MCNVFLRNTGCTRAKLIVVGGAGSAGGAAGGREGGCKRDCLFGMDPIGVVIRYAFTQGPLLAFVTSKNVLAQVFMPTQHSIKTIVLKTQVYIEMTDNLSFIKWNIFIYYFQRFLTSQMAPKCSQVRVRRITKQSSFLD